MKILMLAPEPFFEARGTPYSILGRLKALTELGHVIDLVTYHVGEDVAIPNVTIHRIRRIPFINRVEIGPSLKKLFLDVLLFIKAVGLLRRKSYDLIHSHEESGFFGVFLAKQFRIRHLYDMHSSLPEQLTNFNYTHSRWIIKLFKFLELRTIRLSDAIITICPALFDYVKQIHPRARVAMIENLSTAADPMTVREEEVLRIKNHYSIDGKRVIFYAGTLESYQGIDLLINAAERILKNRQDVMFLIAGGQPRQVQAYQKRVRDLGMETNFLLLGLRPPNEIAPALRLSHVLVSPRIKGTNTPSKIYAYLQSGKPIVATNIYTHTQVLDATSAILVDPDTDSLARGILSLLENPILAESLGVGGRQLFESRYAYESFLQRTERVLEMAVGTRSAAVAEWDLSIAPK